MKRKWSIFRLSFLLHASLFGYFDGFQTRSKIKEIIFMDFGKNVKLKKSIHIL